MVDIIIDDERQLLDIALKMRKIFEHRKPHTESIFSNFPHGACGPASELIARYLGEVLQLNALYVCGERADGWTHAWTSVNGIIFDITADQFGQEPVIVARKSSWHESWKQQKPRPPICTQKQWPMYPAATWHALVAGL